jgi:hypothetical protein
LARQRTSARRAQEGSLPVVPQAAPAMAPSAAAAEARAVVHPAVADSTAVVVEEVPAPEAAVAPVLAEAEPTTKHKARN